MRIAVTGASGLVGSALTESLVGDDHEVFQVVRKPPGKNQIYWNPTAGKIDPNAFQEFDAVVHLAGENIAQGRWTAEKKRRIRASRVQGTQLLSETLANLQHPPAVLVCASAIGYYGDQRTGAVGDTAERGTGFLADVCQAWEEASRPASTSGIRTVNTRIGVVLSPNGGALQAMLRPFQLGVGGVIGSGSQIWSWVSLPDVVGAIRHAVTVDQLQGPINVTAPNPTSNREFTKTLGHVLGRPTFLPLPAFAARLMLGEMADALLLSSSRVLPDRLLTSGYEFQHERLEAALHALLK